MATSLTDRLAAAHQRSVSLYLQRQAIEQSRQQLQQDATQCDRALVQLDGEIAVLTRMQAEADRGE